MIGFPRGFRAAGCIVLAVAALLPGRTAVAEESVELKLLSATGERRLISIDTTVDATLTTTDIEEKTATRSVASQQKATFAEETVSVDDAKRPMQVRLNCMSASVEERAAGEVSGGVVRKSPLQGRIVIVSREGNGWNVLPAGTDPLAADLAAPLGRWLDLRLLLKEGPVKVGDSWTVASSGQVATMVLGKDAGIPEVRCTLGRIVGTPARAEVAVSVRLEKGKEGDTNRLQGQLSGMLVIDLAAGRPLSFSLGGSFNAVQEARDANGTAVGKIDIQARKVEMRIGFEPVKQ
jgi:hypothetical protein